MIAPATTSPIRDIIVGAAVGLLAISGICAACGVAPTVAQCKLDALRFLPKDPLMVTPYDGVDLINRLAACEHPADAGAP